ncbi:hypothetical protein [Streptomyces europaeiscabiei]|uniref:hypothetical protein n=1 Tax=Streptomyces europaeiscabiei TaxID=146819 RepID=UPI002E165C75|nr:hypothetical protein OHB30_13295 [Streptomyces europaeiscabiei]
MHDDTSFDPTLVHRLSRRGLRPGVTDPGQARAVLTRHGDMTSGLPLTELASRYVDPVPHAGATAPIVYARQGPSGPPAAGAHMADRGAPAPAKAPPVARAHRATAADGLAMSARPTARSGADPAGPGTGGPTARPTASPSLASASATGMPMIQRKVAAPPAAPASAPSRARSGPPLASRVPGGPGPAATASADRPGRSVQPKPLAQAHGPVMAYRPSAPRRGPGTQVEPAPATPPALDGTASTGTDSAGTHSSTSAPAVPSGRVLPVATPHAATSVAPAAVPTVVAHPAPSSYPGPPGAASLAAPAEVVSARRPRPEPVSALPLAGNTAAPAPHHRPSPGTAAGWQATGAPATGGPPRPVVQGRTHAVPPGHDASEGVRGAEAGAGHPPRADRGTSPSQSPRPQAPPVDVAHITDQVHQRIVRRLAVEAERRGVRR